MVSTLWAHAPTSSWHVSFSCPSLKTIVAIHHSKYRWSMKEKVMTSDPHTHNICSWVIASMTYRWVERANLDVAFIYKVGGPHNIWVAVYWWWKLWCLEWLVDIIYMPDKFGYIIERVHRCQAITTIATFSYSHWNLVVLLGMCVYCGQFQLHWQFWPLDRIGDHLIQTLIVKFQVPKLEMRIQS